MPFWLSRQFFIKFLNQGFHHAKGNSCQYFTFKNDLRSVGQLTFHRLVTSQNIKVPSTKVNNTTKDMPVKVLNVAEKK